MCSRFTDGRSTGCVAESKTDRHFLPSRLKRLSVEHSPFAGLPQSKRSPQNTVHRKLANNLVMTHRRLTNRSTVKHRDPASHADTQKFYSRSHHAVIRV